MSKHLILAVVAAAALAACGGRNDNDPSPTGQIPASASASSAGFIEYLKSLIASNADTLEPVSVEGFTPPVDDTGQPVSVN